MRRTIAIAIAAMALGGPGCAIASRGAVLTVRYFSPEPPAARPETGSTLRQGSPSRPVVRLRRVRGDLPERIAHRDSEYEVGYYDDRQWTDHPPAFVRRALARTLFERRGFEPAERGPSLVLDVEVLAFEELRLPPLHGARVALRYQVSDETSVLEERTITVDRVVRGERFEDFVAALSGALDDAADRIADGIVQVSHGR